MSHYRSDRTHSQFLLFDVFGVDRAYGVEPYEDFDPETAAEILEQVEAFAHDKLADSFPSADVHPIRLDPVRHTVTLPRDLRASLAAHVASDWLRLDLPADVSGIHVPASLRWAATEFILGANPAVAMCSQLIPTVVAMLHRNGNKEQQRLAELILERNWTVTMVLTEPDAGSDVGLGRTRAALADDGNWHLTGTKRFITWAAHDAAENVIHCVLARPQGVEGQGGPGTKGLSLFMVPSQLFDPETGELLGPNGVVAANIEHKMGILGTPTCELVLGGREPAVGTLLGDTHDGIRQMFEIITYVRMMVGLKTVSALSSGHLNARDYAMSRKQGRELISLTGARGGKPLVEIVDHPDIRRSLLTQKAYAEGGRALVLYTATMIDRFEVAKALGGNDPVAVERHRLLLPIVKTWCAESGWRVLGQEALQVFGGSGYLRDYPLEQYVRDTKIDAIYEGTTGIQSLDLFERRLVRDRGAIAGLLLDEIAQTVDDLATGALATESVLLGDALAAFRGILEHTFAQADAAPRVAALGLTRLLMSMGDVIVGWLLLRTAAAALARQSDPSLLKTADADLAGSVAAGRWFARQVLPHLTAELVAARLLDEEPLLLPDASL
ncbi:MAG: acyl-CoA dehydrogenase family protein [Actinomycetales bacterium]|uniref:Acyl-CoA dehydrogenase family protein n=1 Tax=Candidatus Phosphoribacter hodrii TaxID=2953743 RepID=A0A9D7T8F5_9MICO|nr:acyl-CoA dehydrogenase family protein [Candidatus Phosphoribacter hodrii]